MKKNIVICVLFALLVFSSMDEVKRLAPDIASLLPSHLACDIQVRLLSDQDPLVARAAAFQLGHLGSCDASPRLLAAVSHFDPMVRHNALNALNALGKSSFAIDAATERLLDACEEIYVQSTAISLIQKVERQPEKKKAIEALKAFIDHTIYYNYVSSAAEVIKSLESK